MLCWSGNPLQGLLYQGVSLLTDERLLENVGYASRFQRPSAARGCTTVSVQYQLDCIFAPEGGYGLQLVLVIGIVT